MDIKGQVGLRRKDDTITHPVSLQPALPVPQNDNSNGDSSRTFNLPHLMDPATISPQSSPQPNGISQGGKKTGLLEAFGGMPDLWMGLQGHLGRGGNSGNANLHAGERS